jgi:hypothetical protein
VKPLKKSDRIYYRSNIGWKLLSELELSVGVGTENTIQAWIAERLTPLNLSPGFLNRVGQSAHESARRYLHPGAGLAFGHIHLSIHVPRRIPTNGKTWGFFHIERIQNRASSTAASYHTIEFYLYVEGN